MQNPEKEWFGDQFVDAAEKTKKVIGVFSSVASKYDLMNDLMSLGVHRLWKDRFAARVNPKAGEDILDLAGGTGDITLRMLKWTRDAARITVCDLNPDMLAAGRDRFINMGRLDNPQWVTGNAEALPFPDASFNAVTIAFGLRNVTHIDTALADIHRVLKPGGRFFCLEFSPTQQPLVEKFYRKFSDVVIPQLGAWVANDRDSYQYLVESIRKFPTPENLANRMRTVGFTRVDHVAFSHGIVRVHSGFKL